VDEISAIQMVKARYFRAIDTKDWELLRSVLTEEVLIDVTDDVPGSEPYRGRDRFVATCAEVLAGAVTVHHGHMPEVEVTGAGSASGVWAMEDDVDWGDGRAFHGYGHYHERYQRDPDGTWRIAALTLKRLRLDWR
jgi:hypothetical protein